MLNTRILLARGRTRAYIYSANWNDEQGTFSSKCHGSQAPAGASSVLVTRIYARYLTDPTECTLLLEPETEPVCRKLHTVESPRHLQNDNRFHVTILRDRDSRPTACSPSGINISRHVTRRSIFSLGYTLEPSYTRIQYSHRCTRNRPVIARRMSRQASRPSRSSALSQIIYISYASHD